MKMVLTFLVFVGGVGLCVLLLVMAYITGTVFGLLVPLFVIVALFIWRSDTVTSVDFKNFSLGLSQVQQAKSDVFAKADAVQRLSEQVASLAALMASNANRVTDDPASHMKVMREKILLMLKDASTPDERIAEILRPLTVMIERDMRADIWYQIGEQLGQLNRDRGQDGRIDPEPIRQSIIENYDRTALLRLLQSVNVDISRIAPALHELDTFRTLNHI